MGQRRNPGLYFRYARIQTCEPVDDPMQVVKITEGKIIDFYGL
jgi:hypothetical protein